MNPDWLEQEYLPSLSISNTDAIFDDWRDRATATRAKFPHKSDIRYGTHRREVMDFYPAPSARGCVVYIHGGYWIGFSKLETSFVAEGFVGQGLSVALLSYPLCPEVKIADIRASCAKAFAHLYWHVLGEQERDRIVVSGHSAGGHLAAAFLTEDWASRALPESPIKGVLSLSGVFDVAPLMQTSLNAKLRLDDAQAKTLNLISAPPRNRAVLILAVGEKESSEFHRQSTDQAKNWAGLAPKVVEVPAANHFTIVDSLAATGGLLNRLAVEMAGS